MNDGKMVKLQKRIWRERELEQRDIYLKKKNYDTLLSAVYRSILFFSHFQVSLLLEETNVIE